MESKRVFICDVDYLYTKEAEEFATLEGGAVYVFVKAFDVREVLELLLADMKVRNLEAREIVSISPYNVEQEWASEEEQKHYLYLYAECEKVSPVVFDNFAAYERQ